MDLLHDCFTILERLGVFSDLVWVAEALDAGLLRAIVLCGAGGFEEVQDDITRLLKDLLPPFSVYHSVLSVFADVVGQVPQLATTPSFKTSRIYPAWTNFSELMNQCTAVMKYYNRLFASLKVRACDNSKCPRPGLRSQDEFKQCRECLVSFYCSQECQIVDWRKRHREICEAKLSWLDVS
ncbi:hypothetical protein B0H17DRAFT_1188239, partial [Mycena rosella]